MRPSLTPLAACLIALAMAPAADAAEKSRASSGGPTVRVSVPYRCYPHRHYYGYRASTAAEGYARGLAAMAYAAGQYNRLTAEAAVLNQEAQSRAIENREKRIENYYAERQLNREARAAERGPRVTTEALERFARRAVPDRLDCRELDVATGRIAWPDVLQAAPFAAYRGALESVCSRWAEAGSVSIAEKIQLEQAVEGMLAELKKYVRVVDGMDYMAARNFIKSLAYQTRQPLS